MMHTPAYSSALFRRRLVGGLCLSALALQTACYTYMPMQSSAPPQAKEVGISINDRGRVTLGDRIGQSVDRIDGRIVSSDSLAVVMDVYRVTDLRGIASTWTGERVSIPREAIMGYNERKLSKVRTFALIGAIAAAILASVGSSLDIFGGSLPDETLPPGGGSQTSRIGH
jgi:hypothetical protein